MERDLFGDFFQEKYKCEVVKIAEEAAKKRRPDNIQRRLNGTVENHRGYAIYKDFEDYFKKEHEAGRLNLADWSPARLRIQIREILREAVWDYVPKKYRETRFYEPRGEAGAAARTRAGDGGR